jgi:hypothetical protein
MTQIKHNSPQHMATGRVLMTRRHAPRTEAQKIKRIQLNEERKMLAKKSRFLTNAPNSVFQLGEFLALPKRVEMPRPPKRSDKAGD